ncbi:MAG: transcriptional repressor [Bacteriovoracaceae bacterium]|nr:transcriptional repressor [Bacteriovoracaceae bacterium]
MKATNTDYKLTKRLKENDLSSTSTRKLLFHIIDAHIEHHFDADELFEIITVNKVKISRASMYRTLAIFEAIGIIRKVQFTDRHSHYEYVRHQSLHGHTICTKCKDVISFHDQTIDKMLQEIAQEQGYTYFSHTLEIVGLCRKCIGSIQ